MTGLALLAVLPAGAGRFLSEPGTIPVPVGDLLGLCIPAPDFATAEGARAAVAAQHALLARVALAHDLVPVRPGAVFSTSARVAEHLRTARDDLAARLARIDGCVELTISVRPSPEQAMPGPVQGKDGLAYLRARRPAAMGAAPGQPGRAAPDDLAAILAQVVAACGPDLAALGHPSTDPGVAEATLLVPRGRIASVLTAVGSATVTHAAAIEVRGPWPCYVFSTAEVCHAAP